MVFAPAGAAVRCAVHALISLPSPGPARVYRRRPPALPGSALIVPEAGATVRPMTKRELPIGIRTFREVREEGCCYVDETACAQRLVDGGRHYFPPCPQRFGKSLFADTCEERFEVECA